MTSRTDIGRAPRIAALAAALFGIATLAAGGRILLGLGDAGYAVVRPVLLFNTGMGAIYLAAAALMLRDARRGWQASVAVAAANLAVFAAILVMRARGGIVARETIAAMTLRTVVWTTIAITLGSLLRRHASAAATPHHKPHTR
jgi:hypothetical protein